MVNWRSMRVIEFAPVPHHSTTETVRCLVCARPYGVPKVREPGVYGMCFVEVGKRSEYVTMFGASGGYLVCHGCELNGEMRQYYPVVKLGDVYDIARRARPLTGIHGGVCYWTTMKEEANEA